MIWRFLYNFIFIPLLYILYLIYALFNEKARDGLKGRKGTFEKISKNFNRDKHYVIWFHCSSVGEFEQAKPLISKLKDKANIVLSFFSPSAYTLAKKYTDADLICYLPFDTSWNARKMFKLIKPSLLIFIRFDIWPNYVWTAKKYDVPVLLVDASLHKESTRLYPIVRTFLGSVHKYIDLHCSISEPDAERLRLLCSKDSKIVVAGDTRFDQVIARKNAIGKKLEGLLPKFNFPVLIAGSTYAEDETVVIGGYQKVLSSWGKVQLILVPHEPEPKRLDEIENKLLIANLPYVRLSKLEKDKEFNDEVIIIDRVGVLAELYMLGDITFIGGSFHGSVHNVMEPAVMGKPVIFGPTIYNSLEAYMLMERGCGIMVHNADELASELIKLLNNKGLRESLGRTALSLIEENSGATEKIIKYINEFLKEE
ncbi:MAG: 3-deoxy-D-manno-octulosonic acid transferase [bacterium]